MINTVKFFCRGFFFWMFYFFIFRLLFFLFNYDGASFQQKIFALPSAVFYSLRLDTATACYILIFVVLLFVLSLFIYSEKWKGVLHIYTVLILFILTPLLTANIFLYKSWGTIINFRAISFMINPGEIIASITTLDLIAGILFILLIVFLFRKLFVKYVSGFFIPPAGNFFLKSILVALIITIVGIGTRGGLQLIPINESSAYFSSDTKLNHLATNPIWYLGHNILQSSNQNENPFEFFSDASANKYKELLYSKSDQSDTILNKQKPNIVFILIESYTADIIKSLGGDSATTPYFEKLIQEGLLFTNIYSSGFRTDQAFVSVLSGFPAQPNHSIIRYPEKTEQLPSLTKKLKQAGYNSSFFYGGELGFANLNSYLLSTGFEKIIGIDDFEKNQLNSKWGAHDEFVLAKQLKDLQNTMQPFFSVLMTLSSHEPFETPLPTPFTKKDLPTKFRSAAWYTDKCLENYFAEAKKQSWYNNTLFVLVADHGHLLPLQRDYHDTHSRRIPLLILGGALKENYRAKKINATGNQNDIAATLLNQLQLSSADFKWSNNLLNTNRNNFAYLCLDDAIGWVTDSCSFVFYTTDGNIKSNSIGNCLVDTASAKSYLQVLYEEFLK